MFAFGQGSHGQLGLGTNLLKSDTPVPVPVKEKIKLASCGESHTGLVSSELVFPSRIIMLLNTLSFNFLRVDDSHADVRRFESHRRHHREELI